MSRYRFYRNGGGCRSVSKVGPDAFPLTFQHHVVLMSLASSKSRWLDHTSDVSPT